MVVVLMQLFFLFFFFRTLKVSVFLVLSSGAEMISHAQFFVFLLVKEN